MVRVEIIFDSRNIDEGFLEASLQFEKGIEKTVMWYLFSKIIPSLFTLNEGSTSHLGLLQWSLHPLRFPSQGTETSGKKRETALRCSEPLRSKVGGPKRSSPDCAGWDRLGKTGGRWFFLTHSNMFEVDICGFVIRSFHFFGKLLQ